ncbi:MAG: ABC transporter ATP-binding protein [Candidatus Heimdallarchaeaceae archaeon]
MEIHKILYGLFDTQFHQSGGLEDMISKTIECPRCKTQVSIQGEPEEKILISCPSCDFKGYYRIPSSKEDTGTVAIEVNNVSKFFKEVKAVDGASFKVRKGEIFGFLGPNGAGKTTTIKCMLGLIHMDGGEVKINGKDISSNGIQIKKDLGFLPERVSFYANLTPIQTLNFFCELKGADKSIIPSLLKDVGLEEAAHRKVGTFSKGMVQLLGVAQAQIGNSSILILDEPMSGLDARWVKIVRDKIKMLNERGATIMFSSHILSEVEALCDRVAIISKGKIIAEDTISNLSKHLHMKPRMEITIVGLDGKVPDVIKRMSGVEDPYANKDSLFLTCDSSIRSKIITSLENAGYKISNLRTFEPSLEDAFVKLVESDN